MTTLSDLQQMVYDITNRPDLVNETLTALKAATLKMHHSDFYPKDLFETGIAFAASDFYQTFEVKVPIPRYRAHKYSRYYDAVGQAAGKFFEFISPEKVVDGYSVERVDILYPAGVNLQYKGSIAFQYILFGCYLHPNVADTTYASWIADEHPYAVVFEAARVLFGGIGLQEQSAAYEKFVSEQVAELKLSQITGEGY